MSEQQEGRMLLQAIREGRASRDGALLAFLAAQEGEDAEALRDAASAYLRATEHYSALLSTFTLAAMELPRRYRQLLRLKYVEGLSWAAIAQTMHYERRYLLRMHKKAKEALQRVMEAGEAQTEIAENR